MSAFPHLRAALAQELWAIDPGRFAEVLAVLERRILRGERLAPEEIEAIRGRRDPERPNGLAVLHSIGPSGRVEARRDGAGRSTGSAIAVISLFGIVAQHAARVDDISGPGGTSTERVSASLRAALSDPDVKAIVLNVDSPGGTVRGVDALASEIFRSRGRKPIVAQVNSLAASAAYWIASAAGEIAITPGGDVGSIGVYATHEDVSRAAAAKGVAVTHVVSRSSPYKVEGSPFAPLGEDARAEYQRRVDLAQADFVTAVARGRGVSTSKVKTDFGRGRLVEAREAVRLGMADRVATLDETLQRLAARPNPVPGSSSAAFAAPSISAAAMDLRQRRHMHRVRAR